LLKMRKFFPAANTPDGFYSRFSSIYNEKEDKRIIYIKGGSGTGKSTLMKHLSEDACKIGFDVEQFFCSSDPDSLDGIRINDTKTAIVDATAPHIQDPAAPGISGKLYNIADFWNEELLVSHKAEVFELVLNKKRCFDECYRHLKAARTLYAESKSDFLKIEEVCDKFNFPPKGGLGKTRKLFASGITPKGNVNFLDDILIGNITGIEGSTGSSELLKRINYKACISGYDTELYFCPMFPETKAEHLVIKELNLSFTTLNEFHSYSNIDEKLCIGGKVEKSYLIRTLTDRACECLANAKQFHNQIEKIYIEAMDFDKMNDTYEILKSELFN